MGKDIIPVIVHIVEAAPHPVGLVVQKILDTRIIHPPIPGIYKTIVDFIEFIVRSQCQVMSAIVEVQVVGKLPCLLPHIENAGLPVGAQKNGGAWRTPYDLHLRESGVAAGGPVVVNGGVPCDQTVV